MRITRCLSLLTVLMALVGCASTPTPSSSPVRATASDTTASRAADAAVSMLGKPYKYGGDTPTGFDCSGLVHYSYSRVGVDVSRDTRTLETQTSLIRVSNLRRGDLLFFDQEGQEIVPRRDFHRRRALRPRALNGRQGPHRETRRQVLAEALRRGKAHLAGQSSSQLAALACVGSSSAIECRARMR